MAFNCGKCAHCAAYASVFAKMELCKRLTLVYQIRKTIKPNSSMKCWLSHIIVQLAKLNLYIYICLQFGLGNIRHSTILPWNDWNNVKIVVEMEIHGKETVIEVGYRLSEFTYRVFHQFSLTNLGSVDGQPQQMERSGCIISAHKVFGLEFIVEWPDRINNRCYNGNCSWNCLINWMLQYAFDLCNCISAIWPWVCPSHRKFDVMAIFT